MQRGHHHQARNWTAFLLCILFLFILISFGDNSSLESIVVAQSAVSPTPDAVISSSGAEQNQAFTNALSTLPNIIQITAGAAHVCVLTNSGGVKCWGSNLYGQLGEGSTVDHATPVNVVGLTSGVSAIATNGAHTCALMNNGSMKCWGLNNSGQLGDGTTTNRSTPLEVNGMSNGVHAIVLGGYHTCALKDTGKVQCWGENSEGQLGDGTTTNRSTPVDVSGLTSSVSAIGAGNYHSCAVISGGMKCWGDNLDGQLGDGTNLNNRTTPVNVIGLGGTVVAMTGGWSHTCALMNSGNVQCWGYNGYGQLGDGTATSRPTPAGVIGLNTGVTSLTAGSFHNCAIINSGGAKCWGLNEYGQIGNGTAKPQGVALTDVIGLSSGANTVTAGQSHSCALMSNGSVKCWGANGHGQLGDGTTTDRLTPVDVSLAAPPSAEFDAWPQSGLAPLTVSMHIVSTANLSSCVWDYGDGITGNSCANYHDHIYTNAGTYTVQLTVSGPGGSATMTRSNYIVVSTASVNTPPVANNQNVIIRQDTVVEIILTASDADNDPLTYTIVSNPSYGMLNGVPPNLVYTPANGFIGADSFTFKANDGKADSSTAQVSITVAPLASCYTLTTVVNPINGGTVSITPAPNCQGNKYTQGTTVLLSATANPTYAFSQWSGSANGNMNPLLVVINGDKNITANFVLTGATNTPVPTATTLPQTPTLTPTPTITQPATTPTQTPLPTPDARWIRDQVNNVIGGAISLALDSANNPHAIYYAGLEGLKYVYRTNDGWLIEDVHRDRSAGEFNKSIVIGKSGIPHIVYQYGGSDLSASIKYAKRTLNGWVLSTVDETLGRINANCSIVLDQGDNPHIVYYASQGSKGFKYARQMDESQWEIQVIDSEGSTGSLAIDSAGGMHVAYRTPGAVKYAQQTANGWVSQTIATSEGGSISIALDANDNPHVSYTDILTGKLQYAFWTGSNWVLETLNDEGPLSHLVGGTTLILDSTDSPHIAYQVHGVIKYVHKIQSNWIGEAPAVSPSDWDQIGFALDVTDNPHFMFMGSRLTYIYRLGQGNNSISGRIINSNNDGVEDVNVTLSGPTSASAITDRDGNYSFLGLTDGNYTVTPSKTDYTFSPPSRAIGVPPDAFDQNFIATTTTVNPLPVILVHGWNDTAESWNTYLIFLRSINLTGYKVDNIYTGYGGYTPLSIDENAKRLNVYIAKIKQETKARQVDIVAHSMGGLIARRYIAHYMNPNTPDVHQLIMLGTPNLGSLTAKANQLAYYIGFNNLNRKPSSAELTPVSVGLFNLWNSDHHGVPFYVIAGNYACLTKFPQYNPIEGALGFNDIAVSTISALAIPLDGGWIFPGLLPDCKGYHSGMRSDGANDGGLDIFNQYVKPLLQGGTPGQSIVQASNTGQMKDNTLQALGTMDQVQFTEVQTGTLQPGAQLTFSYQSEPTTRVSFMVVGPSEQMSVSLRDPNGQLITPNTSSPVIQYAQMDKNILPFTSYTISNPVSGTWTTIVSTTIQTPVEGIRVAALRILNSDLRLSLPPTMDTPQVNHSITILAQLMVGNSPIPGATVSGLFVNPDTTTTNVTLFDDGQHNDNAAEDGVYGYQFTPMIPGVYSVLIRAEGVNGNISFHRNNVWAVQVDGTQVFLPMILR